MTKTFLKSGCKENNQPQVAVMTKVAVVAVTWQQHCHVKLSWQCKVEVAAKNQLELAVVAKEVTDIQQVVE